MEDKDIYDFNKKRRVYETKTWLLETKMEKIEKISNAVLTIMLHGIFLIFNIFVSENALPSQRGFGNKDGKDRKDV